MTDILYPVPQPPVSVEPPSRLRPVLAAEVTSKGIRRGAEQPPFGVVDPPRLRFLAGVPVVSLVCGEILRAHASEVTAEWAIPRRAFLFGLPLAVTAAPAPIPVMLRARGLLDVSGAPQPRAFLYGLPQVPGSPPPPTGGSGPLIGVNRLLGW